ncbi:MAG TPA: ATPase, T2SS/T4P/T4SS family [Arthrobacter sp.]
MTKNRARIRATKALSASSDIRHPDASYLADRRKLRLPDGTIHDFATGPLRYLGLPGNGQGHALSETVREASSKGWIAAGVVPGPRLRSAMDDSRPGLINLHVAHEMGTAPDPLVEEIEAGLHRNLNIIIHREPKHGEHRKEPATGRNIFLAAAPFLITGGPGSGRNADLLARALAADAAREALDTLGVPQAAQEFAAHASGLFLVTGTTGSGKTTTGAALLRRAQCVKGSAAAAIMLSCERSIAEHPGVTLYEADYGDETAPRIRAAVDGGAKIIFVDGLYEPESIEAALDAALGGALVIATMHTQASEAAQRLLDYFPGSGNAKIRAKVRLALRGVLDQTLVRRAGDQPGRVLASEVWLESAEDEGDVLSPVLTLGESLKVLIAQGAADPQVQEKALFRRW